MLSECLHWSSCCQKISLHLLLLEISWVWMLPCWLLQILEGLFGILKAQGEEAQQAAIENAVACFETLDEALGKVSGGSPFFGGEKMGFVDIMFAPLVCLYPAAEVLGEFKIPFDDKFPHLLGWLNAFKQSSIASVLPETQKVIDFSIGFMKKTTTS